MVVDQFTPVYLFTLVSGIASIFMVDYSSIFPTDDRPIIDFLLHCWLIYHKHIPGYIIFHSSKNNGVSDISNLPKAPTSGKYGGSYKQTQNS